MEALTWTSKTVPIEKLIPADYNPRKLSQDSETQLDQSIKKFSLADPIVVNADNKIIGGHQRLKILKKSGVKTVDVRVPSRLLSETEEKELNLRLNKNLGEWDFDALAKFDEDMLKEVGFNPDELDHIFKVETLPEADDVPDARPTTDIKPGDLFQLGDHRLLCGDSTKAEDVARLMGGEKADMIFTDPPYNVDYGVSKNPRHKIRTIENDKQTPEEWRAFCNDIFLVFKEFCVGDIYMWGASSPEGMRMRLWLTEIGCHWSATIIWKKQQLVLSPANYQRMYEPCFYGWFGKSSFNGDRKQVEVWEVDRPMNSKLHPTMKPIELCQRGINNSSQRGGIVLDFFGGSGSTLIACEQTSRKCRMIEIDPIYCQVIIDRWEGISGKTAKRI